MAGSHRRGRPVGVITNPGSHRNRQSQTGLASVPGDVLWAAPAGPEDLPAVLADFARREVGTLVIDGGDGTVRDVLSALECAFDDDPPDLALMPSGRTNVITRDVGGIQRGEEGIVQLRQALTGERALRETLRPALAATFGGRRLNGMLFGAGAFTRASEIAQRSAEAGGLSEGPLVALAMAGMLRRLLFGKERRELLAGEPMTLLVDGGLPDAGPISDGNRFLVLVTAMHRLMLGLWPFADAGGAPLHWLDMVAPPRGLPRLTAAAFAGRASSRLEAYGHASGGARSIDLALERPFVLDGDMFEPGPGAVRLEATPPFRFLST